MKSPNIFALEINIYLFVLEKRESEDAEANNANNSK